MIKNHDKKLYIGITETPRKRLRTHNTSRGATFTKNKSCFHIVFLEQYQTLIEARKREIQIKKWRRDKKEMLIKRYKQGFATSP